MKNLKKVLITLLILLSSYFFLSFILVVDEFIIENEKINNEKLIQEVKTENLTLNLISKSILGPKVYKVYIDKLPSGIDKEYDDIIDESIEFWVDIENVEFKKTTEKEKADIHISWIKDFGSDYVGLAHTSTGYIQIGLGDSVCGEWLPYEYNYVLNTVKHEFGHVLGYNHIDNPNNIMYPESKQEYKYIINKEELLPLGYYQYFEICSFNEITKLSIEIESDNAINVYAVSTYEDFENLINNKEFYHYENCQENETTSYKKICTATNKSGIVLGNPSIYNTVKYKIKVKELN